MDNTTLSGSSLRDAGGYGGAQGRDAAEALQEIMLYTVKEEKWMIDD